MEKTRYERGMLMAATARIRKIRPRTTKAQLWKVESERTKGVYYNVIEKSNGDVTCDCPDFLHREETCKHIYAVIIREVA